MYYQDQFSINTSRYLDTFHSILNEMISKMTKAPLTDSISHNFIVQMLPHHRAAIEMSENLLRYTTSIPLQNIALQIISEQTKSISNMEAVLSSCSRLKNSRQDLFRYQTATNRILNTMFTEMSSAASTNQIDADFMREMIPHHQGAIRMSKNALSYPICPPLVPILNAIISSQEQGVAQMQELLRATESCQTP